VIARWIDLCARNRFLVFTGTLLLVLAGIWAERRMPLPDISDMQVIIHTTWNEPPNIIEDQVTYPIVTALLAAPGVKAVRAQTMFGDSYVFVVFEDGTDLYWARSRVLEYLQQIGGRLPARVHPTIGPVVRNRGRDGSRDVVYLHDALDRKLAAGSALQREKLYQAGRHRRRRPALASQTDDRRSCSGEPCADPVGDRRRVGRDETHRRADCRGYDHLHD
jgi:hypothetical protein